MAISAFKEKMNDLRENIFYMARLIREMIVYSVEALKKRDHTLIEKVYTIEDKVNALEIENDERCIRILALYQPEARDLREIVMLLKMNNDFERMGDHAVNIAQHAEYLIKEPPVKPLIDIPRMQEIACEMLDNALRAFINEDPDLAQRVCEMDDMVDELRNQVIRELLTYMMENPSIIDNALRLILVSRDLERIADLTTNICEDVVYMIKGVTIKHHVQQQDS